VTPSTCAARMRQLAAATLNLSALTLFGSGDDHVTPRLSGDEYLGSEEVEVRPPVAASLDPFNESDVALDGAGAVFQRQAVDDGRQVSAQAGGEAAQLGQVVSFRGLEPGGQFLAAPLTMILANDRTC
jgi:hypothetical protein